MKIGIVTYHRSHNYGAMLQAVALQSVLTRLGHETHFIDYWPKHQSDIYRLWDSHEFCKLNLKGKLSYVIYFVYTLLPKMLRRMHFNRFCKDFIIPNCSSVETEFDIIFYGSDQIWRKQYWGLGYNPVYFGVNDFIAKKHISYAASMGKLPTDKNEINEVVKLVKHLDVISVRESELKDMLEVNGIKNVKQTLDPTIILGREEWELMIHTFRSVKEPYLLLYDLQRDCFDKQLVERFASQYNLKVKEIVGVAEMMPTNNKHTTDGPYEFLGLIRDASFVLTSSFHGLVFSIIFNRPFYVSFKENGGRAESLLAKLSLSDRQLPCGQLLSSFGGEIDWKEVNLKLKKEVQESLNFLKETIR